MKVYSRRRSSSFKACILTSISSSMRHNQRSSTKHSSSTLNEVNPSPECPFLLPLTSPHGSGSSCRLQCLRVPQLLLLKQLAPNVGPETEVGLGVAEAMRVRVRMSMSRPWRRRRGINEFIKPKVERMPRNWRRACSSCRTCRDCICEFTNSRTSYRAIDQHCLPICSLSALNQFMYHNGSFPSSQ